jgi:alkyl hydroperoxide reductase subunit AhpC
MEYTSKPREEGGLGSMEIPLIGDLSKDIAKSYGVLVKEGAEKGAAYRLITWF